MNITYFTAHKLKKIEDFLASMLNLVFILLILKKFTTVKQIWLHYKTRKCSGWNGALSSIWLWLHYYDSAYDITIFAEDKEHLLRVAWKP